MKDHKGMVGMDATSKDAYFPGQSGRVRVKTQRDCMLSMELLDRVEGVKDVLQDLQYSSLVCGASDNANVLQRRTRFLNS
ncbi:hypothetical protein KY290_033941 [Solanum tuberosum]|uniref:Uncharacterized protein n=1 Tax=Solanum tuberosum TaxID=4113 RepID=A0ABQ7U3K8_SOLTU|nr:hypothetical protein KY289_033324 [Solanum tuberosum]KAH0647966.1 hypothetical protein KY285_033214 [Solanum tuberosum]KAH0740898.1 hypothetical protein KY290_033941 [Solanum tuberosum]